MYGKLDNNGNITFYNGFYVYNSDTVITNPTESDILAAGYKPVVANGYIIESTDSKITVNYSDLGSYILMEHITESGDMGIPPMEDDEW